MSELIDVHTHLYPPIYLDALAGRSETPRVSVDPRGERRFHIFPNDGGRPIGNSYWSLDAKIAFMEEHGISRSIVSLGNPWLDPFEPDQAVELAHRLNNELASYEARTSGRVLGMGCLPSAAGVDAIAQTVEEIADQPSLHGAVMGTRLSGETLDSTVLEPIWAALSLTQLPVLLHPHYGLGVEEMSGFGHSLPLALGFPFETTLALAKMAQSGVFARHPGLTIIGSHGGGAVPFLTGRLDGCWSPDPNARTRHTAPPSTHLHGLYLDGLVYHPRSLHAVADLVGASHIVFGTDHPFEIADPQVNLSAIRNVFDDSRSAQVTHENAIRLFNLSK